MHVEVIGCTSAGKSTLARAVEQAGRKRGMDVVTGDDLVLKLLALGWVRDEFVRRRLVDGPALLACLLAWRRHRALVRLALDVSRRSPGSLTRKLNLARNALRKLGLYEIVRRRRAGRLVLVDNEGVLQAAHNLFVHVSAEASDADLQAFLDLTPLPEAVVYVRESRDVLLERTLARGHRRVPAASEQDARRFVDRAVHVFEALVLHPGVRERLVCVDGGRSVALAPEAEREARLRDLAQLLRAGVDLIPTGCARAGADGT
jgi:thymidylate kinase